MRNKMVLSATTNQDQVSEAPVQSLGKTALVTPEMSVCGASKSLTVVVLVTFCNALVMRK